MGVLIMSIFFVTTGIYRLGIEERERKEKRQVTYHEMISNAFFNVIDVDKNGVLTLEELRTALLASEMDPTGVKGWVMLDDNKKKGFIEREELSDAEFNFWFNPDYMGTQRSD